MSLMWIEHSLWIKFKTVHLWNTKDSQRCSILFCFVEPDTDLHLKESVDKKKIRALRFERKRKKEKNPILKLKPFWTNENAWNCQVTSQIFNQFKNLTLSYTTIIRGEEALSLISVNYLHLSWNWILSALRLAVKVLRSPLATMESKQSTLISRSTRKLLAWRPRNEM